MAAMNMNQEQFKQLIRRKSLFWWISGRPGAAIAGGSAPRMRRLEKNTRTALVVGKINIDEEPRLAGAEGIEVIPTLVLYRNGKSVDSVTAPRLKGRDRPFHSGSLGEITEGSDMNNNHVYDMLVVGGGPGGYTAALYAARAGLDTIVLEKLSAGGQMALTEQIDNYPRL